MKLFYLDKKDGKSLKKRLKFAILNQFFLKEKLDWLHFGFTTMALQSENIAKSIGAKMAVSCRGYDMDVYPQKYPSCYNLVWKNVDKIHVISKYMLHKAQENGYKTNKPYSIIYPAICLYCVLTSIHILELKAVFLECH